MRQRLGIPITIRVDNEILMLAKREANILKKPLAGHLRELVEGHYRTYITKPLSSDAFPKRTTE